MPDRPSPASDAEVERLAEALRSFGLRPSAVIREWAPLPESAKAHYRRKARAVLGYYAARNWPLPGASAEQREG